MVTIFFLACLISAVALVMNHTVILEMFVPCVCVRGQVKLEIHYVRCAGAGAGGWCWSGVRKKYCWLVGGWRLEAGAGAV